MDHRERSHSAPRTFFAYVEFIDNPLFGDCAGKELLRRIPPEYCHTILLIVDAATTKGPEFSILVMDLWDEPERTFRLIPWEVQGVEDYLPIAIMHFCDFPDSVDEDGIFRGFKRLQIWALSVWSPTRNVWSVALL